MKKSNVLRIVRNPSKNQEVNGYPKLGIFRTSLTLSNGVSIDEVDIAYSLTGNPDGPVLGILGGISAHRHVTTSTEGKGWWDSMVGQGKAIDTDYYQIFSIDYLGGAHDSTGAEELQEKTPNPLELTTADQARAMALVMDYLGISSLTHFIGSSFGGMVGLAFCSLFPRRIQSLICISASHESVPQSIALRRIQRDIVKLGQESGKGAEALALARQLAMLTYRTSDELNQRFEDGNTDENDSNSILSYLHYAGSRFALKFPIASFLALSEALDRHKVDPAKVKTPVQLIGIESDTLVPFYQLASLARQLKGPVYLHKLASLYGHDAFLKEVFTFSQLLKSLLEK